MKKMTLQLSNRRICRALQPSVKCCCGRQDKILGIIGEKASIYDLKDVLNEADKSSKWKGGYAIDDSIVFGKEKFLAVLQEPLNLGHAVFVKGMDEQGYFLINDPADQTAYRMTQKDFLENWGGGIIFYEKD